MPGHRLWGPLLAGAVVAAGLHAAEQPTDAQGRDQTRGQFTRKGAPAGNAATDMKPPLQTGEVQVPPGGVDTSRFDPNAGEGFKGRSTSGGGVIVPRNESASDGKGAPLSGATAPKGSGNAASKTESRNARGAGRDGITSGGTTTGGSGKTSTGSTVR